MIKLNKDKVNGKTFLCSVFAMVVIICLLATGFSEVVPQSGSYSTYLNNVISVAPSRSVVSTSENNSSLLGTSPNGLGIFALNATYNSIYPVGGSYASYYSQSSEYWQGHKGLGTLATSSLTKGIKFLVDIARMYPASVYDNITGGSPPNYTLQSNFYVNGSGQGGEGLYWIQLGMNFMYYGKSGNQNLFMVSPFLEWWWPESQKTGYANFGWNPEYIAQIGPGSPYLVEGWEYTGYNGSGDYVNVTMMERGHINATQNGTVLSDGKGNYTTWFNATYYFGANGIADPSFELKPMSPLGDQGVGIVGWGEGQVVWGNYTSYSLIEELVNGSFMLPQVSSVVNEITGEGAVGTTGGMVMNQSVNPFGLPAYTPYAYITNSTKLESGSTGTTYFPIVIQGYIFPSNASITAYAVGTRRYVSVNEQGDSFYVSSAGYQLTPLILNFSAVGYRNYSATYYPYATNITGGMELHTPFVSLRPLSGDVVYGFMEIPFSYLAYLMDNYIYANGGPQVNMTFWNSVVNSWRDWFPVAISLNGMNMNLSWYVPQLLRDYASVIFNFTKWKSEMVNRSYYDYITQFYINSPVYLPYSFIANGSASVAVESPLLNQSFALPSPNVEYNVTPSMFVFQIPAIIDSTASWYQHPYAIGQVEWNGQSIWVGDSVQASFTFPYSVTSNNDNFNILNHSTLYSHSLNQSNMNYSAFVVAYSYNGIGQENLSVSVSLFNYSVAALVSPLRIVHFPVHMDARLGGSPNFMYPVVVVALVVVLASTVLLRRSKVEKVRKR